MVKLRLVTSPNNDIEKFISSDSLKVTKMLEGLLERSRNGEFAGLAGLVLYPSGTSGFFGAAAACDNPSHTALELMKLQVEILSNTE